MTFAHCNGTIVVFLDSSQPDFVFVLITKSV